MFRIAGRNGFLNTLKKIYTRQTVEAYEKATGFAGIGDFFQERGLLIIKEEQ